MSRCSSPILSIIVPAYNAVDTLGRAVDSLLKQSLHDIEIIVVDDASRDGTGRLIRTYEQKDSRVCGVSLACNSGPAVARNAGLERCTGHWVGLLDADDIWLPERSKRMLDVGMASGADVIADNQLLFDRGADRIVRPGFNMRRPVMPLSLLKAVRNDLSGGRFVFGWLKPIIRRSLIFDHELRYDDGMRYAEDFDFLVKLLLAAEHPILLRDAYYVYTQRVGTISHMKSAVSRTMTDTMAARTSARRLAESLAERLTVAERRAFTRREAHSERWQSLLAIRQAVRSHHWLVAAKASTSFRAWRALATAMDVRLRQSIGWI